MNKKRSLGIILIFIIIVLMIIYYLYSKNETSFALLFIGLFLVLIGYLVYGVFSNKNEKEIFYNTVNRIVKNYSALLVESSIPSFVGKDIIYVKNIDNLANAAIQLRKPIYFIKDKESCAFIVIDDVTTLVTILKVNNSSDNRVENIINEMNGIYKDIIEDDYVEEDAVFDENLKKDDAFSDKTKPKAKQKNAELTKDDAFSDKTRDDAFKDRSKKEPTKVEKEVDKVEKTTEETTEKTKKKKKKKKKNKTINI